MRTASSSLREAMARISEAGLKAREVTGFNRFISVFRGPGLAENILFLTPVATTHSPSRVNWALWMGKRSRWILWILGLVDPSTLGKRDKKE
ncbi:hypothetical protein CRUP_029645 [Coryphaenoides rupestris]|nr:hypothetical protein CRUP_029645 [Coryphaenoides rupestris]